MDPRVKAYQKQTPPRSEAAQPVPDPPPSLLKTTVPGPASPDRSLRKVAKFLILLGQAEAAQVVRHLDTAQVEALGREIADIQGIEPVEAEQILKEFGYLAAQKLGGVQGGPGTARAILDQAFGTERARQVLDRAVPGAVDKPFAFFAGMEPELVTALLGAESPQVHSVVVPFLEKAQAAAFLKTLEPSRRLDLVKRLAKMEQVPSAVVAQVEQALQERYHDLKPAQTEAVDGKARLADILRHMSVNGEQTILQALGEEKPELSDDLRRRLFTAADLLRVGDDGFEELLRGRDDAQVALVWLAGGEALQAKIRSNISARRLLLVQAEADLLAGTPPRELQKELRFFLEEVRAAVREGRAQLLDDSEEYV